jgi:hypothetical protein
MRKKIIEDRNKKNQIYSLNNESVNIDKNSNSEILSEKSISETISQASPTLSNIPVDNVVKMTKENSERVEQLIIHDSKQKFQDKKKKFYQVIEILKKKYFNK